MDSENKKLLLDISTLITLVSDVSNDVDGIKNRFGSIEEWNRVNSLVYRHIIDELSNPLLPKLNARLEGYSLVTIKSVFIKFNDMIMKMGSKAEKERVTDLNAKLTVINDDPNSEVYCEEVDMMKIHDATRAIIGTAIKTRIPLVTGMIKKLEQLDDLFDLPELIVHRPRSFVGEKHDAKWITLPEKGRATTSYVVPAD